MPVDERAVEFAAGHYGSDAELEHPLDVAHLVEQAGFDGDVVTAAVLHDLVEDTDVSVGDIASEFGPRVAAFVSAMTEDESIKGYERRKEEHRRRAAEAGRDVAAIFVADKVSNARRMQRRQKEPKARKIAHYAATLDLMRAAYPDLPLLDQLEQELTAIRSDLQQSPA